MDFRSRTPVYTKETDLNKNPSLSGTPQGAVCSLSGAEVDSLLSAIKDLLPDLGDGFLLACLQEYNYNSEMVINNILEDRLSAALNELDRAMPRYSFSVILI